MSRFERKSDELQRERVFFGHCFVRREKKEGNYL